MALSEEELKLVLDIIGLHFEEVSHSFKQLEGDSEQKSQLENNWES